MTMPNGAAGINPDWEYGLTGDPALGDTPSALAERTRTNIEAALKARKINGGNSVYTRIGGPFHQLHTLLGTMAGKSPFEALAQKIGQALLDRPTHTWPTLADVLSDLVSIPTTLTEHTDAIASLDTITAAMNTTAAYVGDMQDMVTVPRSLLAITGPNGQKCWDVRSPYTIVALALLRPTVLPVIYPRIYVGETKGTIYFTPIVVDRYGIIGKLRWIVGADSSIFSIDYYEIALCAYNPSNGNVEKVWGSGNIVDGIANTSDLQEVEVDMGLTQHTTPGQVLFVAHQQVGPGLAQGARAFAAAPQGGIGRASSLLLDAACYKASEYTQGIPSSISLASLERENDFIPWSGVSVHQ